MRGTSYVTLKVGRWDLGDLVRDPSGDDFRRLLDSIESDVRQFEAARPTLSSDIRGSEFLDLIHSVEAIAEKMSVASGFAHLQYYADTSSSEASALVTRIEKISSEVSNRMLFFDLWFKKGIDELTAERLIASVPSVYREYLRHKRLVAKFSLSEPEEKVINTLEVTGTRALVKIYDKMTSSFEFSMRARRGRTTVVRHFDNREKLVSLVRSPNPLTRQAAYKALFEVYIKNSSVLGEIYQNVVIQWRDEAVDMRGYPSPISVRNIANNLDDATVGALLAACKKNSVIFQDYFREKAAMLGMKKLRRYDLYAPLATKESKDSKFSYGKAVSAVLDTFGNFDPQLRKMAERVFDQRHVDSEIRKAKRGGAFCYTVSPKMTPYVLLNFDGRSRDVATLAHEFGHAVHSMLASEMPIMVAHAPLPLAETASVFAEMLLNEMLAEKMSKKERRLLLAEQIDDMYATIMRQAYFTIFEVDAHRAIAENSATIDSVSTMYMDSLKDQFGSSIAISPEFQWEWVYIPHFYHTPFYTYAYSFGNLLVLSLFRQYKLEGRAFVSKYMKILSAGGSRKPEELLMEEGIDISQERFWQQGFDYVKGMIEQLKTLAQ
ncbi:MAG TPA: M3 family oligoendopeptidase [Nitrososphaera sp.]|nr:M3 family oligoendopeptidase [Nitrososphaera sp.]